MEKPIEVILYILRFKDGTHYTGITKQLAIRLIQHSSGQSKSTAKRGSFVLVHIEKYPCYKTARRQEVKVKNLGAKRYLIKYSFSLS